jgi:thiopeptide-type bacteriocin biosynthesis protein
MQVKRRFFLGDEWLYYIVYASVAVQESLITGKLYELVYSLYAGKIIDKFFFVRYVDVHGAHLRLRFHLVENSKLHCLISAFHEIINGLVRKRIIAKVLTGTYVRELERYGAGSIEALETVFSIDSLVVMNLLKRNSIAHADSVWLPLVHRFDRLMVKLNFDSLKRHQLYEELFLSFYKRYDDNSLNKALLKTKYRSYRLQIDAVLKTEFKVTFKEVSILNLDLECSIISDIAKKNHSSDNDRVTENLIKDLIHMCLNRLFSHDQNLIETVIYYMMSNHYKSTSVKQKKLNDVDFSSLIVT